jgi:hypothetical protein
MVKPASHHYRVETAEQADSVGLAAYSLDCLMLAKAAKVRLAAEEPDLTAAHTGMAALAATIIASRWAMALAGAVAAAMAANPWAAMAVTMAAAADAVEITLNGAV